MATNKAASTKKATAKKPATAKTTVRTVRAEAKPSAPSVVRTTTAPKRNSVKLPKNIVNIVLAELVGTFVLTLVALAAFSETGALYVGLALTVLILVIGGVSGSHINPAVTFGLWATRRIKSVLVPFYWIAQLLGAMLALIITNWVSDSSTSLSFGHFWTWSWGIFAVELIAAAIFIFGLVAVLARRELSAGVRALGIGLSLTIGLVAGGAMLANLKTQDVARYQKDAQSAQAETTAATPSVPYSAYVKGVTANPAIALASTNHSDSELGLSTTNTTTYSYFNTSVILGTLIGAALGGNLYLLIAGRKQD